ncbi:hypothetical protein F5888DRAFT_1164520 [Russula emetica]|nr:hypothetical protein F5888DRAFT_1164520 [Russula emetica]
MTEYPRITYLCPGRTFDRLLKEQSLDETKNVVRKKLGLDAAIELAQLRDGKRIDLEDDDDFEAFKALTKTSLHATVAVIIRKNGRSSWDPVGKNGSGEWRRNPDGPEAAHSPSVQQPSNLIDTPRPRKRRRVEFNGDLVTSASFQPSQQLALEDVRPSSPCEGSPTTVRKFTSEAVALPLSGPTTLRPASQAENMEANPVADLAETSLRKGKKKRNSVLLGKGPSPEHGDVIMSPHTRKKRRKDQPAVSVIPIDDNATPTGIGTATPATGIASLRAGIEVTNPDMAKQAKTRNQKSRPVDDDGLSGK